MQCPNRPACCRRVPADKLPPHSTPANYACQYRQFTEWLKIHYEKVTLISEITPKIAAAYALHLENSGLASGTINKHIVFLKLFFKVLIDNEEIHCTNPFLKLQRKEGAANSRSALSSEQIARLLDSAPRRGIMKIYKTQWEAPDMEQTSLFERRVPQPLAARLRPREGRRNRE